MSPQFINLLSVHILRTMEPEWSNQRQEDSISYTKKNLLEEIIIGTHPITGSLSGIEM